MRIGLYGLNQGVINGGNFPDIPLRIENGFGILPGGPGTGQPEVTIVDHGHHGPGQVRGIFLDENAGFPIFDQFGQNSSARCNHRFGAGQGLSYRPAGTVTARNQKNLVIKKI